MTLTGGHRHDSTQLIALVDAIPKVGARRRFKPKSLYADRAYDSKAHNQQLRARRITPKIAPRTLPGHDPVHGSGLGTQRWPVERTFGWLHNRFRRLGVRYDRRHDIHEACLTLGMALICFNALSWDDNSFR